MDWVRSHSDSVRENWSNGDSARLEADDFDSVEARLGLYVARPFTTAGGFCLTPYAYAGARVELAGRQTSLRTTVDSAVFRAPLTVDLDGRKAGRVRFDIAAGLEARLTDRLSAKAGYRGDFSRNFQRHQAELALTLQW